MFKLTVSNVNSCSMLIDSSQCFKEFENCQHIGLIIASSALNDFNFYNNLGIEIDSTLHGTLSLQMFARKLISSISALQQLGDPFLHDPCSVSTIPTLSVTLIIAYPFGVIPQTKIYPNTQFPNWAAGIICNDFDHNHSGITCTMSWFTGCP